MKILIASHTYIWGENGQGVFAIQLATGLAKIGHQVMVLTLSERQKPYQELRQGVMLQALRSLSLAPFYPDVAVAFFPAGQVKRCFDSFQPEIVHFQDHYPLCRSVIREAKKRGLPLVGTDHFLPENILDNVSLFARFQQIFRPLIWKNVLSAYQQADVITAPTQTAVEILRKHGLKGDIKAITNGVDREHFHPEPGIDCHETRRRFGLNPDKTLFLYVGRLDAEKCLDELVQAFHLTRRDDFQLAIAGKGSQREALEKLAAELGLSAQAVQFLGFVPDERLPALFNCADVFVMPGEAELQSIATLEAMATGLPVLAANAKALPELVVPGVNGDLFEPGHPEDLAQKMIRMTENRDRLAAMGAASLRLVEKHRIENMIQEYQRLYASLLSI